MGKKDASPEDVDKENQGTYQPGAYRVYSPYLFIGRRSSIDQELEHSLNIGNRFQWIFANMNFALGLGPLWRFPVVAYANYGGSFVIAYTIIFLLVGYPLSFLEIALGQSTRRRASKVFQCCAAFEGVAISMAIYSLVLPILYSVLFAYSLVYFYYSFSEVLIWNDCKLMNINMTQYVCKDIEDPDKCSNCTYITPHEVFWNFKVLGGFKEKSERTTLDGLNLPLFACLLVSWCITSIFVVEKVRRHSIKIEYWFTPILLVLMAILLILSIYTAKSTGHDPALQGVTNFFEPAMVLFTNLHIWREATQQVLFSLGIGTGSLITVGSLCRFKSPVHIDSAIVCAISLVFTFVSGILYFLATGLAQSQAGGKRFFAEETNVYGGGLFYIAYTNMFSRLPVPQMWSAIFFLLVVIIGTRAVMGSIDTTTSVISVLLPKKLDGKYKNYTVTYAVILTSILLAMFCLTKRDNFVFYTLYVYPGATVLPVLAFIESMSVVWIYGVSRFSGDVEYMLGFKPHFIFRLLWLLIPLYLILMIVATWSYEWFYQTNEPLLPVEFKIAGWILVIVVFAPIPIKFVMVVIEFRKRNRLKELFKSRDDFGPDELELWYISEFTQERKSVSTNASEGEKKVIDISGWTHEVEEDEDQQNNKRLGKGSIHPSTF